MKWPWGTDFNLEQRKQSAQILSFICQTVALAIIASPFIPGIAKQLTLYDNVYGVLLVFILYLGAMRLLKENK